MTVLVDPREQAEKGRVSLRTPDSHNSYLSDLASLPTFVPAQPDSAPSPSAASARTSGIGDQKTPKPKRRPGEPSPRRDQVGTAEADRAVTHCSFPGPIQLDAMRWLESRIQEVQCPTCGSVSKARLKGSSVVIAPIPHESHGQCAMSHAGWSKEQHGDSSRNKSSFSFQTALTE